MAETKVVRLTKSSYDKLLNFANITGVSLQVAAEYFIGSVWER